MLKKIILRAIDGIFVGIGIGYIMSVIFSTINGGFLPATPMLVEKVGLLKAAQLNLFYSGILGLVFSVSAIVYEREDWSLLKSTLVYFVINYINMFIISTKLYWYNKPFNIYSMLSFSITFIIIFFSIWITIYFVIKSKIKKMNENLNKMNNSSN